jgi:hypothetical protein
VNDYKLDDIDYGVQWNVFLPLKRYAVLLAMFDVDGWVSNE